MGNSELYEVQKNAAVYYAMKQELLEAVHAVNTSTFSVSMAVRGVYDDTSDWSATDLLTILDDKMARVQAALHALTAYRNVRHYANDYISVRAEEYRQFAASDNIVE
jgi:hypothetical protein